MTGTRASGAPETNAPGQGSGGSTAMRPAGPAGLTRRAGRAVRGVAGRGWLAVLLVAAWEVATRIAAESYFPPPSAILPAMREMWFSGPASRLFLSERAMEDFVPSLVHLFAGWTLASLIGIVAGMAVGRSPVARDVLDPVFQLGRAMPPPTLVPFFIIMFHLSDTMYIATIVFGVVWPVLLNTVDGARGVDKVQLDTARVFGLSRWQRLTRLLLPAAAPKIFAGMRVGLSFAVILMVVSELIGSSAGIGAHLARASLSFQLTEMWGAILMLGVLGYLLNQAFLLVERRLLAWHAGARRIAD